MSNSRIQTSENYIANQFNKESKKFDENDDKELSSTALMHIDKISKKNSFEVALDVGSGSSGIMNGFLENNVKFACGVDLSPQMIDFGKKRLESNGYSSRYDIAEASFLDYIQEKKIDAISIHRVICCHPDRVAMVTKAITFQPKMVVITVPRTWLVARGFIKFFALLRKIKPGFRPYIHNIKKIDAQLEKAGYILVDTFQTFIWTTRTYVLK